jgi:hypothetical protein
MVVTTKIARNPNHISGNRRLFQYVNLDEIFVMGNAASGLTIQSNRRADAPEVERMNRMRSGIAW